jgi:hypothetical protein
MSKQNVVNPGFHVTHSSVVIARRSLSLSKTYVVISVVLSIIGIVIANINHAILGLNVGLPTTQESAANNLQIVSALPLIAVPLMVFSTLTFTTPVILLYVYDKNNGVLEYFLSLGMTQSDIYKSYLKAALLLASFMFVYEIAVNFGVGFALGTGVGLLAETLVLTPIIGYPAVMFSTIAMMAFGSLQKQRVGSNQPLGMGIGVVMVLPTYFIPIIAPTLSLIGDLLVAIVIAIASLTLFLLASKLIRREKLLP